MSWAEKRIEAYQKGREANFLEKIMVGYFNPITYTLLVVGGLILILGLWTRNRLQVIMGSFASLVAGNVYSWFSGWTDHRLQEYASGARDPSWVEKRGLEEAHPLSFSVRLFASIFFIRGIWLRHWRWIGFGFVLGILGRLVPMFVK
jgi:hypothetical protein